VLVSAEADIIAPMATKLYQFSPINSKEELLNAVTYVAEKTTELCKKITGEEYPISSLTVFTHYLDEFEKLKTILFEQGELDHENNGPFVRLKEGIALPYNELKLLRVRQPDPYRMQVGCCDFKVSDYQEFKNKYMNKYSYNFRLIERENYEMIELYDPNFDVLAYFLSNQQ